MNTFLLTTSALFLGAILAVAYKFESPKRSVTHPSYPVIAAKIRAASKDMVYISRSRSELSQ